MTARFERGAAVVTWLQLIGLHHLAKHAPDRVAPEVDPWVIACFVTASAQGGDVADAEQDLRDWRGFLLLLERDVGTRDAIDSMMRLDASRDQVTLEVGQLFAAYRSKLEGAHVIKKVKQRQVARARRMSGQGPGEHQRPSDEEFWKESQPPKVRRP